MAWKLIVINAMMIDASPAIPNADLARTLPGGEHHQPQQTETGNKNAEKSEVIRQLLYHFFLLIQFCPFFIGQLDGSNYQQAAGNAERQPENIDRGKRFVLPEVAPRDCEIISKHVFLF